MKKLIKNIRSSKTFGFDKLIKEISNKKVSVFKSNCRWFDIDVKKIYLRLKIFLLKKKLMPCLIKSTENCPVHSNIYIYRDKSLI